MDETLPPRRWIDGEPPANADKSAKDPVTPKSIGPYRVVERLGEGGMGIVYKCRDDHLNRWVALKALHERYARDEHYRKRFRREAQTIASLSHASVAEVHGFGEFVDASGTYVYIVMEYLEGHSVERLLAERTVLPLAEALRIVHGVACGLREALSRDIVHRDVKPSNLLVTTAGQVKILDFGLAKALSSTTNSLTQEGVVLGTPHYISPEQGRGRPVDHRSDIYSLGAAFYHMVTGKPPFEGSDQVAVIVSHVNDRPTPVHVAKPGLPETASRVIDRMMAKIPGDRYAGYDDLISDLERVERGEEPTATFVDSRERAAEIDRGTRPHTERRGLSMLAAGAAGALLAVALIVVIGDLPGTLAAPPLGSWYRPVAGGSGILDLNFAKTVSSADDRSILTDLVRVPTSQEIGRSAEPPRHKGNALEWENFRLPLTLQRSFSDIREIQLDVGRTTGVFDLGVAIVDPLSPTRRALRLRLRPWQASLYPFEALRRGEDVIDKTPTAKLPPRIGPGPFKIFLTFKETGSRTMLGVRITGGPGHKELYESTCEVDGTDWDDGVVRIHTPSAIKPFSVRLRRLLVKGRLGPAASVEDPPWQS